MLAAKSGSRYNSYSPDIHKSQHGEDTKFPFRALKRATGQEYEGADDSDACHPPQSKSWSLVAGNPYTTANDDGAESDDAERIEGNDGTLVDESLHSRGRANGCKEPPRSGYVCG